MKTRVCNECKTEFQLSEEWIGPNGDYYRTCKVCRLARKINPETSLRGDVLQHLKDTDYKTYLEHRKARTIYQRSKRKERKLKKLLEENYRTTNRVIHCQCCKTTRPVRHFQKVSRYYFHKTCIFCEIYR